MHTRGFLLALTAASLLGGAVGWVYVEITRKVTWPQ